VSGPFGAGPTVSGMFTHTHTQRAASRRILVHLAAPVVLAVVSLFGFSELVPGREDAAQAAETSYRWPVKPFDRAHPVRANFGDPRTTFNGAPTVRGLMTSGGIFAFHFGIDISVPDGTPVYPVRSGIASLKGGRTVHVDSGNGFSAEYWHIVPAIRPGQEVVAYETVLGHVMKDYGHVHFSEFQNGRAVNPLAPGHLAPYEDNTQPRVTSVTFRSHRGGELLPEFVHGRVVLVAGSYDLPALQALAEWAGLPVAPARITWRIVRARDGRTVVAERTAFDVRSTIPDNRVFWSYYARGSRQNMSTFAKQRAWRQPGVYLYELTPRPFDTRRLANGIYELVVTATDIRGNSGSAKQGFIVRNGSGAGS
jgi:murein DD-endopeptidase MepM/ murein hydrolase activator NlpD